jgi:hypothetical protein
MTASNETAPMPEPSSSAEPIVYGKHILNGLVVRPDSRNVVRKAIDGVPVIVESNNDYINLYHVFERLLKAEGLDELKLVRKQVGESRWMLYVVKGEASLPATPLERGYDPKRGRYKRYAEQLAAGNALTFSDKGEAVKARRAWQLYVPAEERANKRSTVRSVGKGGRYLVCILSKE